jgi:hypothetical protein
VKWFGQHGRKVSWIVERFGEYGRKSKLNSETIWKMRKKIVEWFGKYGRKVSWNVK